VFLLFLNSAGVIPVILIKLFLKASISPNKPASLDKNAVLVKKKDRE
jgi:hypothetical protein